jgi:hypothetical protein
MRRGQFLQCAACIERGSKLSVLVLAPGLAGLLRQLRPATLDTLDLFQRARGRVERTNHLWTLIDRVRREDFARFRIDAVCQ